MEKFGVVVSAEKGVSKPEPDTPPGGKSRAAKRWRE